MKKKRTATFDELLANYYGARIPSARINVSNAVRIDDLLANYYGKEPAPKPSKVPERVSLSFSRDDGETLPQRRRHNRFEEYVLSTSLDSLDGQSFEEYVVDWAEPPTAPISTSPEASLNADTAKARQEFQVDLRQPLQESPAPAPSANPSTFPPAETLPPSPVDRLQGTPAAAQSLRSNQGMSRQEATDDDFVEDMKAILSGQKVYDPQVGKTVEKDKVTRSQSLSTQGDDERFPAPDTKNGQDIFDRIARSMEYANTYDLGTVELENRFADFDKFLDAQQRADEEKRRKPKATPVKEGRQAAPIDSSDFIRDLDEIRTQSAAPSLPVYAEAQDTSSTSDFRAAIIAQLDKWAGAVEGSALFDGEFIAPAAIDEQRKIAGRSGRTFTTCIDFQRRVLSNAAANQTAKVQTNIIGTAAEASAKKIPGAWHDAGPAMSERPNPGDIYLLAMKDSPGQFSHIGYIKAITQNEDGTETWTTVDGGQGIAGKYDKDGNKIQAGKEAILEVHRTYYLDTDLIKGEANQGGQLRLLKGWIDVDKLVA